MDEVSGPVIAIGLILIAVFVPVGFMGGITGRLYQRVRSITIALSAVLLSVVNALTLSPALAGMLLKAPTGKKTLLTPFYNGFNRAFGAGTDAYVSFAGILARKMFRSLAFIGVTALRNRRPGPADSGWLRARGRSGLHHGQRAAARRGVARAHRRRHAESRDDPGEERGDRRLQYRHRLLVADLRHPHHPRTWPSSSCSSSRGRSGRLQRCTPGKWSTR